jgi:chromosome segregation ATPase
MARRSPNARLSSDSTQPKRKNDGEEIRATDGDTHEQVEQKQNSHDRRRSTSGSSSSSSSASGPRSTHSGHGNYARHAASSSPIVATNGRGLNKSLRKSAPAVASASIANSNQTALSVTQAVQRLARRAESAERAALDERAQLHGTRAQLSRKEAEVELLLEKNAMLEECLRKLNERDKDRESLLHATLRRLESMSIDAQSAAMRVGTTGTDAERAQLRESRRNSELLECRNRLREAEAEVKRTTSALTRMNIQKGALEVALQRAEKRTQDAERDRLRQSKDSTQVHVQDGALRDRIRSLQEELTGVQMQLTGVTRQRDQIFSEKQQLAQESAAARAALESVMVITSTSDLSCLD